MRVKRRLKVFRQLGFKQGVRHDEVVVYKLKQEEIKEKKIGRLEKGVWGQETG